MTTKNNLTLKELFKAAALGVRAIIAGIKDAIDTTVKPDTNEKKVNVNPANDSRQKTRRIISKGIEVPKKHHNRL
jgi:hypothetical protein